jgi:hypothetical protein
MQYKEYYFGERSESELVNALANDQDKDTKSKKKDKAVGHSMEPLIHDGDYCVFRANPAGSRQGKIVLAEHHNYYDPDYTGSYSIKTYTSKKSFDAEGNWAHEEIVLQPKNSTPLSLLKKKMQMSSEL